MQTEIATSSAENGATMLERVVVGGDLAKLTPTDRLMYYKAVCESVGLNPLTRPFEYITLNGKLTLYAKRDCTDQLRSIKGVSITKLERESVEGVYTVTAYATDDKGRTDSAIGAVPISNLQGEAKANAMMKAETKAKRRVTLSLCGLGMLDESETESIPGAVVGEPTVVTTKSGGDAPTADAEDIERNTLAAEAMRLAKVLKLTPKDREAFKQEYLGGADIFDADVAALAAMVAELKRREPKAAP
jgi:hypothetical protein